MPVTYTVTVLLDVNTVQDVDDRAESRSYIIADRTSGKAAIIDAIFDNVERDLRVLNELKLTLIYALETHIHADHITGASLMKDRTGAHIIYGAGAQDAVRGADAFLSDGQELRERTDGLARRLFGAVVRFRSDNTLRPPGWHNRLSGSRLQWPSFLDHW